jgi:ribosomal protein S19
MRFKIIDPRIFRESFNNPPTTFERKPSVCHTYLRNARIPSSCLSKRVSCYNGQKFLSFIVHRFMLGRKFGEFSLTKRLGAKIHEKKKKKKKKGK